MLDLIALQSSSEHPSIIAVLFATCLAFLCSLTIAWSYTKTFRGLSFTQGFVQSIILGSIVATMVMQAIGDSVGRGLGMIGAMAIVRFRTNIKDPRDIMFIFAALAVGIACGVTAFPIAIIGTLFFVSTIWILYYSPLGTEQLFDGLIRFNYLAENSGQIKVEEIFKKHLKHFALVTLRESSQGKSIETSYHVKLKKKASAQALVSELKTLEVSKVQLMMQESTTEL
jgi:uncharacterized membrane protein YhiD involved in acid resistance